MGATAPIDFEKSLIAPIDFDEKPKSIHRFWQFSCENEGCKGILHPSIKIPKDCPVFCILFFTKCLDIIIRVFPKTTSAMLVVKKGIFFHTQQNKRYGIVSLTGCMWNLKLPFLRGLYSGVLVDQYHRPLWMSQKTFIIYVLRERYKNFFFHLILWWHELTHTDGQLRVYY